MKKIPVIGIGASAGGLKEFEQFFKNMPARQEVAFVLIQHLAPDHKSILAEIVKRYTEMDVFQVEDKITIEAGKVYIIPPNKLLTIAKGKLLLSPMQKDHGRYLPIDIFFRSLKDSLGEKAIAVILSGTGSDGTLGIKEVKEAGGLTIVQQPDTSDYDGMPTSAIKTGLIDFIVPVEEMPATILAYIKNEFQEHKIIKPEDEKAISYINQIFNLIEKQIGHDFTNYKRNTIHRRIERRLTVNKLDNLSDYVDFLKENPKEIHTLYKELLISVTSFFRDSETFNFVEKKVIPKIVSEAENETVRIWVPACATGEEAYSWAMLFKAYIDDNKLTHELQVFASDIDVDAVEKAREGFYTNNIVVDVPSDILDRFFIQEAEGYRVKKSIRERVIFADQNLLQDPPYSRLDMVSCRNVLIYLDNELQQKAIAIFHYALKPNCTLVLGHSESLGNSAQYFKALDRKFKVFSKNANIDVTSRSWKMNYQRLHKKTPKKKPVSEPIGVLLKDFILDRYTPPSVVIDYDGEMLYVQGKTGRYLELSTGEVKNNIIAVAREGLKAPLMNTLRKAKTKNEEIIHKNIRVKTDDQFEQVNLSISPFKKGTKDTGLLIVIFEPTVVATPLNIDDREGKTEHANILELEKELAEKEQYLQNTIEELETTNEELKSSNEEAQSTNEELQSTNEELETSKEELQSVNEELGTTNNELNSKNDELERVNNNLKNLIGATDIATIFLDRNMKIFHFTPSVSEIIDLLPSDKGRSIQQFTNNLNYPFLVDDAKLVLKNLILKEKEVHLENQSYFWMRIIPYLTTENVIDGVVITFTNITEKKKQEAELERYSKHLEELVEEKSKKIKESEAFLNETAKIAKIGGWELDPETLKQTWTDEMFRILEIDLDHGTPELSHGMELIDPEFRPMAERAIQRAMEIGEPYNEELLIKTAKENKKWVNAVCNPKMKDGKVVSISGSFQDITAKKLAEEALKRKTQEIILNKEIHERTEKIAHVGSWDWDIASDTVIWSDELYRIYRIDPKEGAPSYAEHSKIYTPSSLQRLDVAVTHTLETGEPFEIDLEIIRGDGTNAFCNAQGFAKKDENGNVIQLFGFSQDISGQKIIEQELQKKAAELHALNEDKDKFISILAHDLKNPFNTILGFSNLLAKNLRHYDQETIEEQVNTINDLAKQTFKMLEEMLLWSRAQSGDISYHPGSFQVKDACGSVLDVLTNHAHSKDITLSDKIDAKHRVFTDLNLLKTILRNLISNAIKFTQNGGTVTIDSQKSENEIIISVADTGIGISKDDLSQIFDVAILRTTTGTNREKGTGLGLLICKEFVEKLGGRLWAESTEGEGSVFYFTIPTNPVLTENDETDTPSAKELKDHYSVLITEDDKANFMLLKILLINELKLNCKIHHAVNGQEAVEHCEKNSDVDLILMDVNMPVMNGFDATINIRKFMPKVPIVMVTANSDDKNREQAYAIGCTDFLEKPIDVEVLAGIVDRHISTS